MADFNKQHVTIYLSKCCKMWWTSKSRQEITVRVTHARGETSASAPYLFKIRCVIAQCYARTIETCHSYLESIEATEVLIHHWKAVETKPSIERKHFSSAQTVWCISSGWQWVTLILRATLCTNCPCRMSSPTIHSLPGPMVFLRPHYLRTKLIKPTWGRSQELNFQQEKGYLTRKLRLAAVTKKE